MNTKKTWYRIFLIITLVLFSASLIIPFISVTSILAPIAMITLIPCNIIRIILRAEIDFDEEQELIHELEEQIKQENQNELLEQ